MNLTAGLLLLTATPLIALTVVAALRDPMRVALPAYAALIPFGGALSIGSSRYGSASSLAGLVLTLGLAAGLAAGRRGAARLPVTVAVWLLFLGLAFASALWSLNRAETIGGIAVLGSLIVVFCLAALSHVDRQVLSRVEDGLIIGGVAAFGYGIFQLVVLGGFVDDAPGAALGAGSRFGNGMLGPNIESVSLLLPLAIALHRAFTRPAPRQRAIAAIGAALLVGAILMTGSRTGTLGIGVIVITLLVTSPRQTRLGLASAAALCASAVVATWTLHPFGIAERTFSSASSSSGRLDIWEVGLQACSRYCWSGSGWGTFPDVYAATQAAVPGARVLTGTEGSYQPHNVWLLAVIELGVFGVLLFTVGLLLALREALRLPAEWRGPATASVTALAFALLFLSSMEFKIFWMVLLLVTLYGNVARAEHLAAQEAAARTAVPGSR